MFALKLALRPWRLQPMSQLLSLLTLSVLLLVGGFFALIATTLPEIRKGLEGDQIASVFLDPGSDVGNIDSVRDQIRVMIGSSAIQMEYIDSDAFLEALKKNQPDLAKEVAALGSEKNWVTPRHFSLRGAIAEKTLDRLRSMTGVESVSYSAQRFQPIIENLSAIGWMSQVLFASILFAMLAVLILLGRLNGEIFSEAESIVAQMGGASWQARFPARLNPLLLTGVAGLLSGFAFMRLYPWFAAKLVSLSPFFSGIEGKSTFISGPFLLGIGLLMGLVSFVLSPRSVKEVR